MTLDTALVFVGFFTEAVILGLLIYRRIYKNLPLFSSYVAWSLLNDVGVYLLVRRFPTSELRIFLISVTIDSIFMFGVLIEISMSILKPVRSWLPRWAILAVSLIIAVLCGALWHFVKIPGFDALVGEYQVIVHLQLTSSAVRILYFLFLAGLSQLLSIGWRDRELQIATGFGFYSIATLSAVVLHNSVAAANPAGVAQYHIVDQMVSAVYICSMIYWGACFAQEVPERREFTPQMQSFLLALAGNARTARVTMENTSDRDRRGPRGR